MQLAPLRCRSLLLVLLALPTAIPPLAAQSTSDSAEVARTVQRLHEALATGDSTTALQLLAEDALILESGGLETRDEYRAHHLPADIAFARAVRSVRDTIHVVLAGDVAWATSISVTTGTFRERPVDSQGAELMVLARSPGGWRIRAIHWSSRSRRRG